MALKHPEIPNSMKNGSHGALPETPPPKMANLKRNAQHSKIYQKQRRKFVRVICIPFDIEVVQWVHMW
uniref:Uncharacterized protein n=1 Tax=Vitis vinifera TaxID=29760 RepID=F6I6J1_VITVI